MHFNPYNTVEFYVGEVTPPKTVSIYTDETNHVDIQVSEGNKWYSYLLPKDKGLCSINGNLKLWDYDYTIKKVIVKANISYYKNTNLSAILPYSTVEASFKGSNTSNVTNMGNMFYGCENLTSLDVSSFNTSKVTDMCSMFSGCTSLSSLDISGWDTINVTNMGHMFGGCNALKTIRMVGCSTATIKKITDVKPSSATIVTA